MKAIPKSLRRLALLLPITTLQLWSADPHRPADFTIGSSVVQSASERFGINVLHPYHNNWTKDPGMEPVVVNLFGEATGGGARHIQNNGPVDTSYEGAFGDGFFNGASVRIYRPENGVMTFLRDGVVSNYLAGGGSQFRIELTADGPAVQAGDQYFLRTQFDNVPFPAVGPASQAAVEATDTWFHFGNVTKTRDRSTVAPVDGGQTSLRLVSTEMQAFGIGQQAYGPVDANRDSLEPGRTYRMEAWLRHEGYTGSSFTFEMDGGYSDVFLTTNGISTNWQRFHFDFVAPDRPQPGDASIHHGIVFFGEGTIWIDNFRVYDPNQPDFQYDTNRLETLRTANAGAIRINSGNGNEQTGATLDDWTNPEVLGLRQYNPHYGAQYADADLKLPTILPVCEEIGANPWLMMGLHHSEEEWHGLIDYLAGPGTNTYDAKRVAQGRLAPWSDAFERIYLEVGNETWNPQFEWRMQGTNYGQLAEYFFNVIRTNANYSALENKLVLVIGGQMDGAAQYHFGASAVTNAPSADMLAIAPYIAGWEADLDVANFQEYLLFSASRLLYQGAIHRQTQIDLAPAGHDYDLVTYEFGPGYPLPTGEMPVQHEMEVFGKSLAGGVGTMDTMLGLQRMGVHSGNFFHFFGGTSYASHGDPGFGFHPHPAFIAVQMANEFALDPRVSVSAHSNPTRIMPGQDEYPDQEVDLIDVHAYQRNGGYTVIVLSRELSNSIPVTLRLPFDQATGVTLHTLAGDPQANNTNALNIAVQTQPAAFQGAAHQFDMPAGSIHVYEFHNTSLSAFAAPSVVISRPVDQPVATTSPSVRFNIHFSQAVTGFDMGDVVSTGSAAATGGLVEPIYPYDGSAYEVTVQGMTASGSVDISVPAGVAIGANGVANTVSSNLDSSVQYTQLQEPGMSSPTPGSVLSGSTVTFTWSGNDHVVDRWFVDIGSQPGWTDYLEGNFPGTQTSATVSGLPINGSAVHVRLTYLVAGQWFETDYQYQSHTAPAPGLTAPANDANLPGANVEFQWTDNGHGVEQWLLDIGTAPDGSDLLEGNYLGSQTNVQVNGLPTDGATLYIRLSYRIGSIWNWVDYEFTAAGGVTGAPLTLAPRNTGSENALELRGAAGASYLIEFSNDLRTWSTLVSVTTDAGGRVVYTDSAASGMAMRFYRARAVA